MRHIVLVVALLMMPWQFLPSLGYQPPAGQDWVIDADLSVSDETILMGTNNITVRTGVTLELENVSLNLNHSYGSQGGIVVETGAVLKMGNCTLNTLSGTSSYPTFRVFGSVIAFNCTLSRLAGGLYLRMASAVIEKCRFTNNPAEAINTGVSTLVLSNTRLECGINAGVRSAGCDVIDISDCVFKGTRTLVSSQDSTVNMTGTRFHRPDYESSVKLVNCRSIISGCDFGYTFARSEGACPEGVIVAAGRETSAATGSPGLTVQDCDFKICDIGVELYSGYYSYDSYGIYVDAPGSVLVSDCSFYQLEHGIAASPASCRVQGCTFQTQSGDLGMSSGVLDVDNCIVRNCTFEGGEALYVYSGGATIEDCTINSSGYYSDFGIYSQNSLRALRNRVIVTGTTTTVYYGIYVEAGLLNATCEIKNNVVHRFYYGIICRSRGPAPVVADNTITGTSYGIELIYGGTVSGNSISASSRGIFAAREVAVLRPSIIRSNTVRNASTGITAEDSFVIEDNKIWADNVGILAGASYLTRFDAAVLARNEITVNLTGMDISYAYCDNGTIEDNRITNARWGMEVVECNLPILNNVFTCITGYGIRATDHENGIEGNQFSFRGKDLTNCSQVLKFWDVQCEVEANRNPPNLPPDWRTVSYYYLNIRDNAGYTAFNGSTYSSRSCEIAEYVIWSNGTNRTYNPYTFTARSEGSGGGSTVTTVNNAHKVSIKLVKGPDLVPVTINVSQERILEGDLVDVFAYIQNDDRYNPDDQPINSFEAALLFDGERYSTMQYESIPDGNTAFISCSWVATPGWHNFSVVADPGNSIEEVFEDNNERHIMLYVAPLPRGTIEANGTDFEAWQTVSFAINLSAGTTGVTGYRFDFGDGELTEYLACPDALHVYTRPGQYVVRAWIATTEGAVKECFSPLQMNITRPAPRVELLASPDPVASGRPVMLTAVLSRGLENVSSLSWFFGDGGYAYGTDVLTTTHAYEKPGNYTAVFRATFDDGLTRDWTLNVTVLNSPPKASGKVVPDKGAATTVFAFSSDSSDPDGTVLACIWDFGDGTCATAPWTTHSYARHGSYRVTMTAIDDFGSRSLPVSLTVVVDDSAPAVSLSADRYVLVPGGKVSFDASGTRDPDDSFETLRITWDFGDGQTGDGAKIGHIFSKAGEFTITLKVESPGGAVTTRTVIISVKSVAAIRSSDNAWQVPAAAGGGALMASIITYILIRMVTHRHDHDAPVPKNGLRPRRKNL